MRTSLRLQSPGSLFGASDSSGVCPEIGSPASGKHCRRWRWPGLGVSLCASAYGSGESGKHERAWSAGNASSSHRALGSPACQEPHHRSCPHKSPARLGSKGTEAATWLRSRESICLLTPPRITPSRRSTWKRPENIGRGRRDAWDPDGLECLGSLVLQALTFTLPRLRNSMLTMPPCFLGHA